MSSNDAINPKAREIARKAGGTLGGAAGGAALLWAVLSTLSGGTAHAAPAPLDAPKTTVAKQPSRQSKKDSKGKEQPTKAQPKKPTKKAVPAKKAVSVGPKVEKWQEAPPAGAGGGYSPGAWVSAVAKATPKGAEAKVNKDGTATVRVSDGNGNIESKTGRPKAEDLNTGKPGKPIAASVGSKSGKTNNSVTATAAKYDKKTYHTEYNVGGKETGDATGGKNTKSSITVRPAAKGKPATTTRSWHGDGDVTTAAGVKAQGTDGKVDSKNGITKVDLKATGADKETGPYYAGVYKGNDHFVAKSSAGRTSRIKGKVPDSKGGKTDLSLDGNEFISANGPWARAGNDSKGPAVEVGSDSGAVDDQNPMSHVRYTTEGGQNGGSVLRAKTRSNLWMTDRAGHTADAGNDMNRRFSDVTMRSPGKSGRGGGIDCHWGPCGATGDALYLETDGLPEMPKTKKQQQETRSGLRFATTPDGQEVARTTVKAGKPNDSSENYDSGVAGASVERVTTGFYQQQDLNVRENGNGRLIQAAPIGKGTDHPFGAATLSGDAEYTGGYGKDAPDYGDKPKHYREAVTKGSDQAVVGLPLPIANESVRKPDVEHKPRAGETSSWGDGNGPHWQSRQLADTLKWLTHA